MEFFRYPREDYKSSISYRMKISKFFFFYQIEIDFIDELIINSVSEWTECSNIEHPGIFVKLIMFRLFSDAASRSLSRRHSDPSCFSWISNTQKKR